MKQGSLIIGLLGVMAVFLCVSPLVAAQNNDAMVTVEPSPTVVTPTLTVETPTPDNDEVVTVEPSPTRLITVILTPTPRNLISLQGLVETKPANTDALGTWIIAGLAVEADSNTQLKADQGPLLVGSCVSLVYFFDGTFNIAVTIESEPLSLCTTNLNPPTPDQTPTLPTTQPTPEMRTWRGTVTLQGRDQHGGINIFMSSQPCGAATFSQPITTTNASGNFEITTTESYQCFKADNPLYLSARQPLTNSEIGPVMLKGGDVDGDGVINIIDIAALARNFETNNPAFDLNADGIIDIFDLVLAASNFQR